MMDDRQLSIRLRYYLNYGREDAHHPGSEAPRAGKREGLREYNAFGEDLDGVAVDCGRVGFQGRVGC